MNNLGRTINIGERLVTTWGAIVTVKEQTFGCFDFTAGTCIGTDQGRIEGYDIDKEKTEALQSSALSEPIS